MRDLYWTALNILISTIASLIGLYYNWNAYQSLTFGFVIFISLSLLQQMYSLINVNQRIYKLIVAAEFEQLKIDSEIFELLKELSNLSSRALNKRFNRAEINQEIDGLDALLYGEIFDQLENCRLKIKEIANGDLVFNKELGGINWQKVISLLRHTYQTTNILSNTDTFGRHGIGSPFYNIQRDAIDRNCTIERIFIYQDDQEYQNSKKFIKEQVEAGIKVKIISMADYNTDAYNILARRLGCSDFAIIDDRYVYTTSTDANLRRTSYIRITSRREILEAARELYAIISSNSRPLIKPSDV